MVVVCVHQALHKSDFLNIFESKIKNIEPVFQENIIPLNKDNSIVRIMKRLDAK